MRISCLDRNQRSITAQTKDVPDYRITIPLCIFICKDKQFIITQPLHKTLQFGFQIITYNYILIHHRKC